MDFIEDEELHSGILSESHGGRGRVLASAFGEYLAALGLAWEPDHWERISGHLFEERWNEGGARYEGGGDSPTPTTPAARTLLQRNPPFSPYPL